MRRYEAAAYVARHRKSRPPPGAQRVDVFAIGAELHDPEDQGQVSQLVMRESSGRRAGISSCVVMHQMCILMCMRTTLNIHDDTLKRAAELTGVKEKTALVRMGLEALIARESSKRLAELGATERELRAIPRRRTSSD